MELGEAGGDCHLIGSILDMLICPFVLNYNCYLLSIHVYYENTKYNILCVTESASRRTS